MATIRYTDPALPVMVTLEAFSPFIPLNEDDSGLPVTILSYRIRELKILYLLLQPFSDGWKIKQLFILPEMPMNA